jgi:trans-2,3-dihydro-3-hydroxyanthranilate isomerase
VRRHQFATVDVFTDRRFGGNQLAVITDARGLSSDEMQAIAAEFNFSETTFVLPPDDPAHTARVRIFNRTAEMPFAGHPNVGTAFVLAETRGDDRFLFEEQAGLVAVDVLRSIAGAPVGATITAPQSLTLGDELSVGTLGACASVQYGDIILRHHPPRWASTGNWFILAEVSSDGLGRAAPDVAAFRLAAARDSMGGRLAIYLYARDGDSVRARMFAPLAGMVEDAATGSAATTLGALMLSLSGADDTHFEIVQGIEMGRPSRLRVAARRGPEGIVATVGGTCVAVTRGEITV